MKDMLIQLLPLLVVLGTSFLVLLFSSWWKKINSELLVILSIAGLASSIAFSWQWWVRGVTFQEGVFPLMVRFDSFSLISFILFAFSAGIAVISSFNYANTRSFSFGEYLSLILFAVFGAGLMACGTNLMVIFIGLEILSLPLYVLAGFNFKESASHEASVKYFLLGALASVFFLFGIAFYYGATGSTDIMISGAMPPDKESFVAILTFISAGLIISGLGFKISAVPFHFWTPDVYQGAPLPVTTFFATTVKAAAFIAFFRVFGGLIIISDKDLTPLISVIAVATMVVGNLSALFQEDLKRLLAYSSIAHAGYMLLAFTFLKEDPALSYSTMFFYLLAYMLMTAGAFIVISMMNGTDRERASISDFAGLSKKSPWLALAFSIFLFSLAGFPPTGGFFAKFYLFKGALDYHHVTLVIIAVLNSLVAVYYYMRPVVVMYFGTEPARTEEESDETNYSCIGTVAFAAVTVILLGIFPSTILAILQKY
ncbi:MAG: NADH-quinone oxidoreductase subunit N [Deltaproteobacteria bacterium CG11_big_fil_rev_8_21_14_0_20_49_13]|nr:MAG: NADH-quinone oxidoreductase subunit N [Deltaproteobacteria bacterium CG11_big_fil_rev_8_21_14_0_20_49_13]